MTIQCEKCGAVYKNITVLPLHCSCQHKPSLPERVVNYAAAWTRWALRGMPTRDENQIRELLSICIQCDQYDAQGEACNACGCCTNKRTQGWANKIAMATEHCPLQKW